MRGLLEGDPSRIDVEIAMQRFLGDLQRVSNEPVEFDVVDVRSCLSAHEVQIFAVAFSAVAKTQCGTALKHHMAKHAYIGQGGQQMKMNRLLDQVLLHLAADAMLPHEVGDRALDASGLAVHDSSLRKSLRPEFPRRSDPYSFRHGGGRGPIARP